jgi:hypothetical protein
MGANHSSNDNKQKHFIPHRNMNKYYIDDSHYKFKLKKTDCDVYIKVINSNENCDKKYDNAFTSTDDVCIEFMIKHDDKIFVETFSEYPGVILNLQRSFFNTNGTKCGYELTKDGNLCVSVFNTSAIVIDGKPAISIAETRYVLKKSHAIKKGDNISDDNIPDDNIPDDNISNTEYLTRK